MAFAVRLVFFCFVGLAVELKWPSRFAVWGHRPITLRRFNLVLGCAASSATYVVVVWRLLYGSPFLFYRLGRLQVAIVASDEGLGGVKTHF